ncbi:MAG: HAMP domain-containing histidine kinase [Planctomycetes bacterium]|nr:HAMP domain-containing histidine kinase [Planctomycetota bacterium]
MENSRDGVSRGPLLLFLAILVIALAQVTWWNVLLVRDSDPNQAPLDAPARRRRIIMVAAEGSAFALAMTSGAWLIFRSLRHEEQLRRAEANFLAAVTHELKSPLASLRLHAESLELRPDDADRVKTYSSRMLADVERLNRSVENLLAAGRAQAGLLVFHPVDLDLSKEILQYIEYNLPMFAERGFEIAAEIPPDIRAPVDPQAFQSVLENLIDNAIKYSEPPSEISLKLYKEGPRAALAVGDHGVGLDPPEAARVFERFYRAGDERVRTTKGTGLGLYLVSEIARAHGGGVAVESAGKGFGATFRVFFPLAAQQS